MEISNDLRKEQGDLLLLGALLALLRGLGRGLLLASGLLLLGLLLLRLGRLLSGLGRGRLLCRRLLLRGGGLLLSLLLLLLLLALNLLLHHLLLLLAGLLISQDKEIRLRSNPNQRQDEAADTHLLRLSAQAEALLGLDEDTLLNTLSQSSADRALEGGLVDVLGVVLLDPRLDRLAGGALHRLADCLDRLSDHLSIGGTRLLGARGLGSPLLSALIRALLRTLLRALGGHSAGKRPTKQIGNAKRAKEKHREKAGVSLFLAE